MTIFWSEPNFADFVVNRRLILARIENEDQAKEGDQIPKQSRDLHDPICTIPMEGLMCKSLVAMTAALAVMLLGSLVSDHAQAGGATSAPSKYNNTSRAASLEQVRHHQRVQTADFGITEFSSSSAKSSVPKR